MNDIKRKQFVSEVKASGDRTVTFTISTGGVDRDNDTINPAGWNLDAYRRNPVLLFAHDYGQPPIGRALDVRVQDGKLVAVAEFAPGSIYEFAETCYQLVKGGFLNAVSVGFRPTKFMQNTERGGVDFVEQELLEFSCVPVPANPQALVVGRGLNATAVKAWLSKDDAVVDIKEPKASDRIVLELIGPRRSEPFEPLIDISPADVKQMMRGVIRDALNESVRDAARLTVGRMRGRVD